MGGTDAHLGDLEGIASKLRTSGMQLEGSAQAPPAPQVGTATGAVASALAMLATSAAGIAEGMGAIGDAVSQGRDLYQETDQGNADSFNNLPR